VGIELPAELAELADLVDLSWPQADEEAMRVQARAWRDAAAGLNVLAGEADALAGLALAAMSGPAGDAARTYAARLVDPSSGSLSVAARDAGRAADRLEHAAEQIGAAKAEMIRRLVEAAKNYDVAQRLAPDGHPAALLGAGTALSGTAVNLATLADGLVRAVGPDGGAVPDVGPAVANPGAHGSHGQAGLLGAATGLPTSVVQTGLSIVDEPVVSGLGVAAAVADGAGIGVTPGGWESHADDPEPLPGEAPRLPTGGLRQSDEQLPVPADPVPGAGPLGTALPEVSAPGADPAGNRPQGDTPGGARPEGNESGDSTAGTPSLGVPVAVDGGTGPIALGHPAPGGASSAYGGLLGGHGFEDAPTPAAGVPLSPHIPGQTAAAGLTDASVLGGPAPAVQQPAVLPALQQPAVPPAPAAYGAAVVGGPAAAGPAVGQAPFGQAPFGASVAAVPAPGGVAGASAPPQGGHGAPWPRRPPGAPRWSPYIEAGPQQQAPPVAPPGAVRHERAGVVALFLVHMFPIGHMPVAADRPVRQLPPPCAEVDYAAGLRFPPHDHPNSALIDPGAALESLASGVRQPCAPPATVLPKPPAELVDGHEPLGGLPEREWERRYVVRSSNGHVEYAWPPGELYPEGGHADAEPVLLTEGSELDRFGDATGRVFAPAATPFERRSLPPTHLATGYRRYRVQRDLPMWQAVSASWFGQPGGGTRYRAIYSAAELVTLGYLADVTFQQLDRQEADAE